MLQRSPITVVIPARRRAHLRQNIDGRPERVTVARAFAAAVLGGQHPEGETAAVLLSELVTSSVPVDETPAMIARGDILVRSRSSGCSRPCCGGQPLAYLRREFPDGRGRRFVGGVGTQP